jgi:hypothetical protein
MQLEHLFMFIVQKFQKFFDLFAIFSILLFKQEHMSSGSETPCRYIDTYFVGDTRRSTLCAVYSTYHMACTREIIFILSSTPSIPINKSFSFLFFSFD